MYISIFEESVLIRYVKLSRLHKCKYKQKFLVERTVQENGRNRKQIESRDSKITIVSRQVGPTAKNYARPSLSFSFLNLSEESLS